MPRAFLITHRRYNVTVTEEEFEETGFSPEQAIRIPDYSSNQPTSDGVSDCGSETSSECPEELYNLTKLAEVSLAAAAGTLIHPSNVIYHRRNSQSLPRWGTVDDYDKYRTISPVESHKITDRPTVDEDTELSLQKKTRLFFERIESECKRETLEDNCLSLAKQDNESDKVVSPVSNQQPIISTVINTSRRSSSVNSDTSKIDNDNEIHECPDCGKKYSTSSNLARHRQTHRSLGDKKARRCPHCDKVYVSMPAFSMHVRTHNQGCKCHYCGKCFSRPWLLQGHIRTHTGEKPFKCTICNKAFADKSNLRAHVQTHSNTKPHICGRCGKAFALKSYLYKHEESSCMRAHHRSIATEKKEDTDITINTTPVASLPSTLSSEMSARVLPSIISSPTSVIVSRPGFSREPLLPTPVPLTTIIRHTKSNQLTSSKSMEDSDHYMNDSESHDTETTKIRKCGSDGGEYLSRMVIRTSVISSPNPIEQIPERNFVDKNEAFNFTDPNSSAFTRSGISLNFGIA